MLSNVVITGRVLSWRLSMLWIFNLTTILQCEFTRLPVFFVSHVFKCSCGKFFEMLINVFDTCALFSYLHLQSIQDQKETETGTGTGTEGTEGKEMELTARKFSHVHIMPWRSPRLPAHRCRLWAFQIGWCPAQDRRPRKPSNKEIEKFQGSHGNLMKFNETSWNLSAVLVSAKWLCFCPKWHGWSLSWTSVFEPRSSTHSEWRMMFATQYIVFYIKRIGLKVVVPHKKYHSTKQMYKIETTNTHCEEMLAYFNQHFNEADWWSEGRTLRTTLLYILLSGGYIDWYSIQLIVTLTATLAHSAKELSQPSPRKGQTLPESIFHTSSISPISDMLTVPMVLLKHIIIIQYVLAHLNNSVTCVVPFAICTVCTYALLPELIRARKSMVTIGDHWWPMSSMVFIFETWWFVTCFFSELNPRGSAK